MSGVEGRPHIPPEELPRLAAQFGLPPDGLTFSELPSYDDLNFRVATPDGQRYVLKVHNSSLPSGTAARLEAQNRIMARLRERGLPVSEVLTAPGGVCTLDAGGGLARVLTYLEGDLPPSDTVRDAEFLEEVGATAGRVATALEGFEDEGAHWTWDWDMKRISQVVRARLPFIASSTRQALASRLADEYEAAIAQCSALPHSVIHGDLNDTNLLVRDGRVVGILDFGDSIYTCTAFEPAIAAGYCSLGQPDPMEVLVRVLRGYLGTAPRPLTEAELSAYFHAARGRILLSVAFAAEYSSLEPENEYVAHTSEPGWAVLEKLGAVDVEEALVLLRRACEG